MVSCKHCQIQNSLDSTFCRKCGAAISEAEVVEARAKLDTLVSEGHQSFSEGRTDESLAIAENVLFADGNHSGALWLKAMCHERQGEIAEALECADRIVELNPDSELDRIRRNQLRTKLSTSLYVTEKPDRRVAIVGAVAAGVLVLCVGVLAASMTKSKRDAAEAVAQTQVVGSPTATVAQNTPVVSGNTMQPEVNNAIQGTQQMQQPAANPGDVPPIRQAPQYAQPQVRLPEISANSILPNPAEISGGIGSPGVGPVTLEAQPNPVQQPPRGNDPDPDTTWEANNQLTGGSNSVVEINVHRGTNNVPRAGGESSPRVNQNGLEALTRAAYNQFQLGEYAAAAGSFERALQSGGDAVTLNQRLGQAYERLGRLGDAIEAYRRSVRAGEAAIAGGAANPGRIKDAVESSRSALNKLGG
jgi:tetratricopeptide (TPR) repeat protein